MHIGPLQLAAIAFENPIFKGEILAELDAVRGRGVIRLIDLLFIYREASGDVTVMTDTDVEAEDLAAYGDVLSVLLGLGDSSAAEMNGTSVDDGYGLSLEEIRGVVDQMPPDTALALVLLSLIHI